MKVINESRVDFEYKLNEEKPTITKTVFSNNAVTYIVLDGLEIEKSVNKKTAHSFDILTYDINIKNPTKNVKENVYFKDILEENLQYVKNTLHINNKQIRCTNNIEDIAIGEIGPEEIIHISFKALLVSGTDLEEAKNTSTVVFDYLHNIDEKPTQISLKSNEVSTSVYDNLFKQIKVETPVTRLKHLINCVIDVTPKIKILKMKVVDTPIVSTNEHKEETLCSFVIIGVIEYNIVYHSKKCNRIVEYTTVHGFSSSISIPYGVNYCRKIHGEASLVNTDYMVLNCGDSLFLTSIVLLKVR